VFPETTPAGTSRTIEWEAHVALGILLVLIGGLFLLDSLDLIEGVGFGQLWPVLVIAVGAAIIYDRVRRNFRRR